MIENLEAVGSGRSVARNLPTAAVSSASYDPAQRCTAITTTDEHEFDFHSVENTAADHDEPCYFRPLNDVLDFDG
jgi:hypothetical protein